MRDLPALVLFAFVSSGTPGPNNVLLWASGLQFGFRATVPQIVGTSAGIGILALAVAAGLGVVVTGLPEVELALKLVGSCTCSSSRSGSPAAPPSSDPRSPDHCVSTKRPCFSSSTRKRGCSHWPRSARSGRTDLRVEIGSAIVIVTMIVVVLPTAAIWAAGGTALHRLTRSQRAHRALNGALALLLALSIAFIWI